MKRFHIYVCSIIIIIIGIFVGANLWIARTEETTGRQYRVDISRAAEDIQEILSQTNSSFETVNSGAAETNNLLTLLDTSAYPTLLTIEKIESLDDVSTLEGGDADYAIREINGSLYRFDYQVGDNGFRHRVRLAVNISLGIMAAVLLVTLLYVRLRLLKPFHSLRDMPYELSKGHMTTPLKEEKSRYFGKFIWGMDLLRERLEQQRLEELRLQKEKKTLILSITHDIKTPLSAIKLYAKALSKNLYDDRERQTEIAENINARADDIENFLAEITKASSEDFLNLQTDNSEFYLSHVMNEIEAFYSDKLGYLKIDFSISPYTDCLLNGDKERSVEVLQNVIENAIKYGNGTPIQISFSDEENCRLISVANSSCTLTDNELPHIFDSFWRGANAEKVNGNGLGLYICRQLMNKMGGEIFARKDSDTMIVTAVFQKA